MGRNHWPWARVTSHNITIIWRDCILQQHDLYSWIFIHIWGCYRETDQNGLWSSEHVIQWPGADLHGLTEVMWPHETHIHQHTVSHRQSEFCHKGAEGQKSCLNESLWNTAFANVPWGLKICNYTRSCIWKNKIKLLNLEKLYIFFKSKK